MNKEEYKEYMRNYVRRRYLRLKLDAIEHKGGKCRHCGYDKCPAALVFHHRDPNEKEVDWGHLKKRSWKRIKEELDKCDLLCANCHQEEHWDEQILQEALSWLDNHKRKPSTLERIGTCEACGAEFERTHNTRNKRYCSQLCSHRALERTNWPEDSEFLRLVADVGQVQTGKKLGVSARAVAKRMKRVRERNSVVRVESL